MSIRSTYVRILCFVASVVACVVVCSLAVGSARQSNSQNPVLSPSQPTVFFPPDTIGFSEFFSQYLDYFGEPSLLAGAQDPSTLSYRLDAVAGQRGFVLVIRLSMNSDGRARIFISEQLPGTPPYVIHRTIEDVSASDVKTFFQLIQRVDFWSMRPALDPNKTGYVFDADVWVFEGARNGSYHVVLRFGPDQNSFSDMVRFLTKNLAKLDVYRSPSPSPTAPHKPTH